MDKEKIFTGTLQKRYTLAREALQKNYTPEVAEVFYETYKAEPLSFILAHSREIFAETYKGLEFYRHIMKTAVLNPDIYIEEIKKLESYINDAKVKNMSRNQLVIYESLVDELRIMHQKMGGLTEVFGAIYASEGGKDYVNTVIANLYSANPRGCCDIEDPELSLMLDGIVKSVFNVSNIYAAFGLGVLIVNKYHKYVGLLLDLTDRCLNTKEDVDADMYKKHRLGGYIIQKLMTSSYVTEMLQSLQNMRLNTLWTRISNSSIDAVTPVPVVESNDDMYEFVPSADGSNIADLRMFVESFDESPNVIKERYDFFKFKAAKLSADLENMDFLSSNKDAAIYESTEDLQHHAEASYLMLEWEDDGSPNAVIAKHIMTSKEKAEHKASDDAGKHTAINIHSANYDKNDEVSEADNAICKNLEVMIAKIQDINPGDEAAAKAVLAEGRKAVMDAKKEIGDNDYPRAKYLVKKLTEEINDNDETVTEGAEELEGELEMFLESDGIKEDLEATSSYRTSKPKEDLATKVQNKALDSAAKSSEKYAKRKESEQKLKNAGNALAETPKRMGGDIKDFVSKFDKWDENRRKEFMMKPGFRHKIWSKFKTALMYGFVAHVKLAWIPLAALLHHCSKLKDKRIRDEVSRELEAEIKICEEKISDANAKGDNSSKYELMRIKQRLEAERIRVRTNSKFV